MSQVTALKVARVSMHERLTALADEGKLIAYFGYGSLVNPDTHRTPVIGYANARLRGWQRRWTARPDDHPEPIALLTSSPTGGADEWLAGLIVFDHVDSLASLDAREAGYDRRTISAQDIEVAGFDVPAGCPVYAYEGRAPHRPQQPHLILQSYLDAVLQGYARRYDHGAVDRFVASTAGFDRAVLRDRRGPRYPRAVILADDERTTIDKATAHLNFVDSF